MKAASIFMSLLLGVAYAHDAHASVLSGSYTTGGSTTGTGPWTMTADSLGDFSVLRFIPGVPVNFGELTTLSVPYDVIAGGIGGGAPRFSIVVDANGNNVLDPVANNPGPTQDGFFNLYWGPSPSFVDPSVGSGFNTGNLLALTDNGRYDLSPLGGSPFTDRAAALALAGNMRVWRLSLILDTFSPFPDRELRIGEFRVEAEDANLVPEPASLALWSFSMVGLTAGWLRRRRNAPTRQ